MKRMAQVKTRHRGDTNMRKCLTIVFCFLSAFVFCSALLFAANKKQTATSDTAALKRISESARIRLEQLRAKEGFPGANFAFVLPDGAAASVSVGVSDIVSQRPLIQISPKVIMTINKDGNRLFAQGAEIFPSSETEYFFKVVDAQITFRRNEKGEVTGLVVTQAGNSLAAPKIK